MSAFQDTQAFHRPYFDFIQEAIEYCLAIEPRTILWAPPIENIHELDQGEILSEEARVMLARCIAKYILHCQPHINTGELSRHNSVLVRMLGEQTMSLTNRNIIQNSPDTYTFAHICNLFSYRPRTTTEIAEEELRNTVEAVAQRARVRGNAHETALPSGIQWDTITPTMVQAYRTPKPPKEEPYWGDKDLDAVWDKLSTEERKEYKRRYNGVCSVCAYTETPYPNEKAFARVYFKINSKKQSPSKEELAKKKQPAYTQMQGRFNLEF